MAATDDDLYVGGDFVEVGGVAALGLAGRNSEIIDFLVCL
jgi:hypothetical protein